MKRASKILSAPGLALGSLALGSLALGALVLGLALSGVPAGAQQQQQLQLQPPPAKPASPAAVAAAREILAMKKANAMFAGAVPNMVQQAKGNFIQNFLNYQKDLNEVAVIVAQSLAGRENEIGEGMANVYANEFTEQELKDLVTFYKTPLGQKLLAAEPRAIQFSIGFMNQWAKGFAEVVNAQFRAEMHKRGKDI